MGSHRDPMVEDFPPQFRSPSLRDQLREILPKVLPPDPQDAVRGTELIYLIRQHLNQRYSDATLRYHFSVMCCDLSAPIAKVDQGQGYYLRRAYANPATSQSLLPLQGEQTLADEDDLLGRQLARSRKFQAIFALYQRRLGLPVFLVPTRDDDGADPRSDLWKFPDAILARRFPEMPHGRSRAAQETARRIDLRSSLGLPPLSVHAFRLCLAAEPPTARELFFQAVSTTSWAHSGELAFAQPISDPELRQSLFSLGTTFGIGIASFGIPQGRLDELAEGPSLIQLTGRPLDSLLAEIQFDRITAPTPQAQLDWDALVSIAEGHPALASLLPWLAQSPSSPSH